MRININEGYRILDFRGLVLKSYWQAKKTLTEGDKQFPEWKDGFLEFLTTVLDPILEQAAPRKLICVKDDGNQYRSTLYPSYKQKRKEKAKESKEKYPRMSEEVKKVQEETERFLRYLGVKFVTVPGQEADDMIALLCQKLDDHPKIVYTVDADLLQLANSMTQVWLSGEIYGPDDRYNGVPVHLVALHKSLVGDSSDEYPGVSGFGPAKWAELEKLFGLDGLEQLEEIVSSGNKSALQSAYSASGNAVLGMLLENFSQWSVSYLLAKLHPEVCYGNRNNAPLRPVWEARVPDKDRVNQMLVRAKAPDLLGKYDHLLPSFEVIDAGKTQKLVEMVEKSVKHSDVVAFDFESYDTLCHQPYRDASKSGKYVDVLSQRITGISFCCGDNFQHNYYVSFEHADTNNLSREWMEWLLKSLYTGRNLPVVQNASFEMTVAKVDAGLDLPAPFDTQIMQSYVDENEESHLKDMTLERFRYRQTTYEEVTDGKEMNQLSAEHVLEYGCDDSLVTALHFDLQYLIMRLEGSWDFYSEKEVEHVLDSVETFIEGTDIDFEYLGELEMEDRTLIEEKTSAIRAAMEKNCMVKDTEKRAQDAKNLLDLWWELESAKLADEGASEERIKSRYQELWEKAWHAAVYVPYTEQTVKQEFIPTKTKINAVFSLLDSELRVEKVTKSYLSEWLVENEDVIESSPEKVRKFVSLMAQASHQFPSKKRSGPEYEALKSYAESLMNEDESGLKTVSDGDELNFGSSPQMVEFLYGKLGLPLRVRSKVNRGSTRDKLGLRGAPATGNKASAAAIVYDLQDEGDWRRQVILDYLDIVKAQQNISLYYKPYPLWKSPKDGRIHPQIKNCGTVTRRPTGTAPNVLQVSSKDGAKIRKAYVPPSRKYAYVCLDFNGQELRITASESEDRNMLEAYIGESRKDIHSLTASGFAHILLPREGLTEFSSPLSYDRYLEGLNSEETHASFNLVRKLAKACIAEGSEVLTDRGLIPIEKVRLSDKLWDGVEWVSHDGVIFKGVREVIEYDGLVATEDHEVYLDDGRKIPFGEAAKEPERSKLAVGEIKGTPIRYFEDSRSVLERPTEILCSGENSMHILPESISQRSGCASVRSSEAVSVQTKKVQRPKTENFGRQIQGNGSEVHEQEIEVLQELRGEGDSSEVRESKSFHIVDAEKSSSRELQGRADRQDRQQRALRAGESEAGFSEREFVQQADNSEILVSRPGSCAQPSVGSDKDGSPEFQSGKKYGGQIGGGRGGESGRGLSVSKKAGRKAVYDILNAGPRHRFTVSGKIVSNCNFLLVYGGGYTTLAQNLLIAPELAQNMLNQTFDLYSGLRPWQQRVIEFARVCGYVETAFGNRRHLTKDLYSQDDFLRSRQERQAVNATIQGCAADILKHVLNEMRRRKILQRYSVKALKPVYDEVAGCVLIDAIPEYIEEMKEIMEITPPGHKVPMEIEAAIGFESWGAKKELGRPTMQETIDFINEEKERLGWK